HLREPELVRALLGRAIISMSICEFENASREFRAALEFVDERGLVHDRAEVLAWMAHSAVVRLELDEADVLLRELDEVLKHVPSIYARIEGASCRSMLQVFRMDLQGAAEELHRAVRIARQAGLRHSELDLHLDRALVCLLAFDLDGHESALSEIGEIAADWAAPARVLAELEKHRLAQRLIRKEIEARFFIEEVAKIEKGATPGAIFALIVLLGTPTLTEVVQANRSSIARLQERALVLGSERDAYTRGFFLMLHCVAKAAEPRLGIPWPVSPRAAGTLWVSVTASYFAFDDGESDLGTKPQLHTILRKLANERNLRPGIPVSSEELTQCVWPGEKMLAKAAKNRLHVAIVKLRGLGLSNVLSSQDGGYLLDPSVPLVRVFDPLLAQ
ncbi:MAG: hypothetical protein KBF88_13340, partial [Polyangiaceae bacterium]|nr:hypothetical protein [Polyangiaceae bacterium]